MSAASLLIEIGTEELPANACAAARAQAGEIVERELRARRLAPNGVRALVAPRRIAVLAAGVPRVQAPQTAEHRGPPERVAFDEAGALTAAGAGFARKHGLPPEVLERREGFVWVSVAAAERPADEVLGEVVQALVGALQFPKNMRWGRGALRFARPLRWLCVLHGEVAVEVELEGAIRSSPASRGHRFLSAEGGTFGASVQLASADGYLEAMRAGCVLVDDAARRSAIETGLGAHAGWSDPAGVLAEVVDLGEWPTVMRGAFDPEFLELPARVIVTAMQSHQRYFPLTGPDGALAPAFLFVSNGDPAATATIVAGNERVLRGRLDDARFAYRRDLSTGLEAMAVATARIAYHARAGSIADRTARLGELVALLAAATGVESGDALAAARLAKADLGSTLVGEFAELQGHVGAVYARAAGQSESVAAAIEEHYRPVAAGSELPASEAGALLALADRLDALAVAFAVGEQPTGSRDPYGLRRAAAGVAAIALAREWPVDLGAAVRLAHSRAAGQGAELSQDSGETARAVTAFVLDRVDAVLDGEGVAYDLVRCARGADPSDPVAHARLARALAQAAGSEAFADVHTAYTRCHRLAAKGLSEAAPALVPDAFLDDAERALAQALARFGAPVREAAAAHDFAAAIEAGAALRAPVDAFFDAVLVMHSDVRVRANRLRLLVDVTSTLGTLGDLSEVTR